MFEIRPQSCRWIPLRLEIALIFSHGFDIAWHPDKLEGDDRIVWIILAKRCAIVLEAEKGFAPPRAELRTQTQNIPRLITGFDSFYDFPACVFSLYASPQDELFDLTENPLSLL